MQNKKVVGREKNEVKNFITKTQVQNIYGRKPEDIPGMRPEINQMHIRI